MRYEVIACTNKLYVGWVVSIPKLHKGILKITRPDGAQASFPVVSIIKKKPIVTLSSSNFVAQLKEIK